MGMAYKLEIATPDGEVYTGNATRLICRTIDGDVCIMARHTNYCTALGMGLAKVTMEDGTVRNAACMGGMLTVMEGVCRLVATTWEWQEDIDFERASRAKNKAEEQLDRREHLDDRDVQLAEAKLKRALIRTSIAKL